ncbi:MAG: hypothetical protein AAGM67_10820, partial [Bacteroidota bacterium]
MSSIWPGEMGREIFFKLEEKLLNALRAKNRSTFQRHFDSILAREDLTHRDKTYLERWKSQGDHYANYSLSESITLGKHGSTHAEQNHGSFLA